MCFFIQWNKVSLNPGYLSSRMLQELLSSNGPIEGCVSLVMVS